MKNGLLAAFFAAALLSCNDGTNVSNNPQSGANTLAFIKKALTTMAMIDEMFKEGTIEQKRKIISSIYPEKMSFEGNTFRTARINSIVGLILPSWTRVSAK